MSAGQQLPAASLTELDPKVVATLRARAALSGFQLEQMADGSFVIARWTMARALANSLDVETFFAQAGIR